MPDLPAAIAAYFEAPIDADSDALGRIFTPDAHVRDEQHDHRGLAEIRCWRIETHAKTQFATRPQSIRIEDGRCIVSAEVSGAFPNSPVTLDHAFTLADDRIADLEIG